MSLLLLLRVFARAHAQCIQSGAAVSIESVSAAIGKYLQLSPDAQRQCAQVRPFALTVEAASVCAL